MGLETASVPAEMLLTFKEAVSGILTPHARAILLDPEYELPAAKQRAKSAGLLPACEQRGYDKLVRGRMPRLLEGWTAQQLVEAGADSVKVLLYYSTPARSLPR
jgi:tagatose 1,6-diphosphate aldolase